MSLTTIDDFLFLVEYFEIPFMEYEVETDGDPLANDVDEVIASFTGRKSGMVRLARVIDKTGTKVVSAYDPATREIDLSFLTEAAEQKRFATFVSAISIDEETYGWCVVTVNPAAIIEGKKFVEIVEKRSATADEMRLLNDAFPHWLQWSKEHDIAAAAEAAAAASCRAAVPPTSSVH